MSAHRLLALIGAALLTAACATASPPVATPTPEPPITVMVTRSAQPFLRAAADRALTGPTPFMIVLAPTQPDLLLAAAQEPIIGISLYFPAGSGLWAAPLAEESIAVVVNPASPLTDLSLDYLADIYAGRDASWAAAVREEGDDSRLYFDSVVLRGVRPAATIRVAPSPEAMLQFVADTANGIGYIPLRWIGDSNTVKVIAVEGRLPTDEGYALSTFIVAFAQSEPTGPAREWLGKVQEAYAP